MREALSRWEARFRPRLDGPPGSCGAGAGAAVARDACDDGDLATFLGDDCKGSGREERDDGEDGKGGAVTGREDTIPAATTLVADDSRVGADGSGSDSA